MKRPARWWVTTSITLGGMLACVVTAVLLLAAETPGSLQGVSRVSAARARTLAAAGAALIDTRAGDEYVREHIPGATSVPYRERSARSFAFDSSEDTFDLSRLPADKSAPMIFYCDAGECWSSYKAARVAVEAGYAKVHWLRGGIPEWRAEGYAVEWTPRTKGNQDETRLARH